MAGRIPERDIAAIRERVRIEDIVGEYVALRRGGADSMKGLCPFHDEKTPSFHVRPNHGHFHCFGCGEGGDVFSFLQKIEHIGFVEAVEQMADNTGYQINYEGGGTAIRRDRGTRARLVAANAAAQEFYAERLAQPDAEAARAYLRERDFDAEAARTFGCGYAPAGWDTLTKHLLSKGFEFKELEAAGLSRQGKRGPMDRFHRRLLWPIRSLTGDVIGFGARRLHEDDPIQAKYVNTPETLLYKKSQVLFGLDLAKREIAKRHQAVIVEGYTDVMAMHLAGVPTAVAACGTAFGGDHLTLLRRLLLDDSYFRGEIIYTFDGDSAGQAAALKAFDGDQKVTAQTFVSIAPDGQDPCELRMADGDAAVRDLIARRVPMFEFAIRSIISGIDLDTEEGRVEALRRSVPIVARIKDPSLRDGYATRLADHWVGWPNIPQVVRRVREESRRSGRRAPERAARPGARGADPVQPQEAPAVPRPDRRDPVLWPQRESLKSALQEPGIAGAVFDSLPADSFTHSAYATVRSAIEAAGGTSAGLGGGEWVEAVSVAGEDLVSGPGDGTPRMTGAQVRSLVSELAVEDMRVAEADVPRYIGGVLARLQEVWVGEQIADLKSKLQRMSPAEDADGYRALFGDLVALEQYRRGLLDQAVGARDDVPIG
ncbi:DNA primase [Tomitella fengzijianii]|uniref:DNA primase n=1 Tax=Tomitella fengzijianii TaxID=2597660 RepID=A0A516X4J2_9ACTN|nr:DNA primase [Tomitella fengzijianii]QDQ97999.1 DNA primase [Tomitella fengzijianii]